MHYLEGHFDSAVGKLVSYLVPDHQYKSVHDFFNPSLFHSALINILPNIPDLSQHLESLKMTSALEEQEPTSGSSFTQVRMRNFKTIWQTMEMALGELGHDIGKISKENLFRMVKDFDLDILQSMLEPLFQLLIRHHGAIEFITELSSQDQTAIKDFLQRSKEKAENIRLSSLNRQQEEQEHRKLENENIELRHLLDSKETDLQRAALEKLQLEDQLQESRQIETAKEGQIDSLKKRLMAYEETDTLFQQKDEEIHKLNKTMTQLQLTNRLLTSDLTAQRIRFQSKISELEQTNGELQLKADKMTNSLEVATRQRDQTQVSNKKVIANLKDKIKTQSDRMNELQNQLVDAKIARELREREFSQLWANYESLRSQSLNETTSKIPPEPLKRFSSTELEGSLGCSGQQKEFLRLGEEINQLQKLHESAFEEEIMMFESGEDNLKKVQDIINENNRLKQKVAALASRDHKSVLQENEKLRKRMAVMKKRVEETETQKREQLDLMVSAFQHCLRSKQ